MLWGIYEGAESRLIRRYLRSDLDIVELGASLGVISTQIAKKLAPGRRLLCVEANPELMPLLRANVRYNAPHGRVTFVNAAVCDAETKTVTLVTGRNHAVSRVDLDDSKGSFGAQVPAIAFRRLLQDEGIRDYGLVCDIEGAEASVLLDNTALEGCQQLLIELHETHYHGKKWLVDELVEVICDHHRLELRERRDAVCVFERARVRHSTKPHLA